MALLYFPNMVSELGFSEGAPSGFPEVTSRVYHSFKQQTILGWGGVFYILKPPRVTSGRLPTSDSAHSWRFTGTMDQ